MCASPFCTPSNSRDLIYRQVHYHIVPAPQFSSLPAGLGSRDLGQRLPLTGKELHRKEYESRDDLDEDVGHALVGRIKAHL
jgi:hypothetical protein